MTSPKPYPVLQPRTVTPGLENQNAPQRVPEPGVWCRPDWIRLVGGVYHTKWLHRTLRAYFGHPTGTNNGAAFFAKGTLWHPGVMLSEGHSGELIMLDLQGARLAIEDPDQMLALVEAIYCHGFHATRVDLAVDWVGQDVKLYEHARVSCKASELCKARTYQDAPEYTTDQQARRLLLYLGKRSSAMCGRIYDKGLETGEAPEGHWERLEIEFKQDRAHTVMMAILDAGKSWSSELWQRVIGAIDFRTVNGRSELTRRERVAWWSDLIGGVQPKQTKPLDPESNLASWESWARGCVLPRMLQIAEIMGIPVLEYLAELLAGIKPSVSITTAVVEARLIQIDDTKRD